MNADYPTMTVPATLQELIDSRGPDVKPTTEAPYLPNRAARRKAARSKPRLQYMGKAVLQ